MPIDNRKGPYSRRQPQQARSRATVDAILVATVQVLLADGLPRLTTVRVAERAGVSVGTLYQYFPQKRELLFAVLKQRFERVASAIEDAAASAHNAHLPTMVKTVVAASLKTKAENLEEARALYAIALELDSRGYAREVEARHHAAIEAMLETAPDVHFVDIAATTSMFMGALMGPIRLLLEGALPQPMISKLSDHLESLCLGYLEGESVRGGST
ncbi:TetR/AcrR family transcriptional regulator [Burkholderia gladioli pv. gladioli]|nr:TetR/AcrR family transcriptional regulator [Burkholderia gladioli]ASD79947.1 TetR family transcriptional regulator [Burkholderia gladioli pv. gladioli]AWY54807.1 TetR family transcriptional regulator [Burkholderia gladioli pv. gladioli]MDJ1164195.1 TetR/AcrR family transcriptional regulator [Burkholderia gladioli pv. gladioli]PEH37821.1 TetR/AcrR family transcriptional regulator [Burkholderia gladioli]QPQ84174.1 TetR/AcrR family transcriptional regulator [Burkholderia gladioli]